MISATPGGGIDPRTPVSGLGAGVLIRTVGAGDEEAIRSLLGGLDSQSSYRRWFTGGVNLPGAVRWAAHPERCSGVGLLAFAEGEPVGHAVLVPAGGGCGEIAFEVAAPWRRHGIAGAFLRRLLVAAADLGLREVYAEVLCENSDMLAVLREHGQGRESREGGIITLTLAVPAALSAG